MRAYGCLLALALTPAFAQTKISGVETCGKPDPTHVVEIGDRPGHVFVVAKAKCTWSKAIEMEGIQSKEDEGSTFTESNGKTGRDVGYDIGTMANGDKFFVHYQGTSMMKDGNPSTMQGKWSFVGGTGKFRGLKGSGTYKSKATADGGSEAEIEGEYTLPPAKK